MANWTRAELEALTPFEAATRQVGDELVPMTQDEYDRWIDKALSLEKPVDEPLGES